MESFLIEWPPEEKWFISHSRIEGEGKVMVFELLKEGETRDNWQELASMTAHIGARAEKPENIWHNLIQQAQQNFPEARIELMSETLNAEFPAGLYSVEGNEQSTICRIVQGKEGVYLSAVVFREPFIEAATKEKWIQRLQSGEVKAQGIQETLKQSNLIHLHLPQTPKHKNKPQTPVSQEFTEWLNNPIITPLFHPEQPGDLSVHFMEDEQWKTAWVNIIDQKKGIYRGAVLPGQDYIPGISAHEVFFFQYAPSIRRMIRVTPAYLAEIGDWKITPCNPCRFDMLVKPPSEVVEEGQLYTELQCPNCGGKQILQHKHYIPPVEELTIPEEEEEKVPWWKRWLQYFLSFFRPSRF